MFYYITDASQADRSCRYRCSEPPMGGAGAVTSQIMSRSLSAWWAPLANRMLCSFAPIQLEVKPSYLPRRSRINPRPRDFRPLGGNFVRVRFHIIRHART